MQSDESKTDERLHFKNPPIVEAVIQFSISAMPDSLIEDFQGLSGEMAMAGYRRPEPINFQRIQLNSDALLDRSLVKIGVKFASEDGLHAVQFRKDAFIFSRLGRYDTWEEFRNEAKRMWEFFSRTTKCAPVVSAGVRYINKLFIPIGVDPEIWVRVFPKLPEEISTPVDEMFMRVGMAIPELQGRFVHTQTLLPVERDGFVTLILDNDFQFPTTGKSELQTWETLEEVRVLKDRYFRYMTTDKMRETFDA